ncbi:hypothetical protein EK21DRAFT_115532 [Setomelanomma holmii]|uniref:Uncharacterized protein n=1 Tax=Setomelanomma holmii TaxID=210430 RepID=A0A9P4LHE2_9PLEO|nr:hypothetical protein EK21DRAFT_115532 [Setomelanomma holmii]
MLGRPFLETTGTFKKNAHRVKEREISTIASARQCLLYVDDQHDAGPVYNHIQGRLNGQAITALADTSSEITVIKPHRVDVHVMDDLPCDFILDKWLLYDNHAFTEHEDIFVDPNAFELPELNHACLITEKKRYKVLETVRSLGDAY